VPNAIYISDYSPRAAESAVNSETINEALAVFLLALFLAVKFGAEI
jgi:hypothetical protein